MTELPEARASSIEVSLVVESYNSADGQAPEHLETSIDAAVGIVSARPGWELLITDTGSDSSMRDRIERAGARRVPAEGLSYDKAKVAAAEAALGRYVLYLDGDCRPLTSEWADVLVDALERGAPAVAGLTAYPPGLLHDASSLVDFGFLVQRPTDDTVGCYAFNNVGFRREVMLSHPPPDRGMRCHCYLHAQALIQEDLAVRFEPRARVEHAPCRFWDERLRRGLDHVVAGRLDPTVAEASLIDRGYRGVPALWRYLRQLDRDRLPLAADAWGWTPARRRRAALVAPVLRAAEMIGVTRALRRDRAAPLKQRSGPAESSR